MPNTRQKMLVNPSVAQTLGLIRVYGNPVLPMTRATSTLLREALESGLLEEFSLVGNKDA